MDYSCMDASAAYTCLFILNSLRYYITTSHISKFYQVGSRCKVALYNKSQGMALSTEPPDITGLNHTLQQLITQL